MSYVLGRQLHSFIPTKSDFYQRRVSLVKKDKMYRVCEVDGEYKLHTDMEFFCTRGLTTGRYHIDIYDDVRLFMELYRKPTPRKLLDTTLPLSSGIYELWLDDDVLPQLLFVVEERSLLESIHESRMQRLTTTALVLKRLGLYKDLVDAVVRLML
jgi:hypothetical protein